MTLGLVVTLIACGVLAAGLAYASWRARQLQKAVDAGNAAHRATEEKRVAAAATERAREVTAAEARHDAEGARPLADRANDRIRRQRGGT